MRRRKVLLYNPQAVFYTMPLALVAIGSALDPRRYEVCVVDGRLEGDPGARLAAVLDRVPDALCLGVSVISGAPIRDALRVTRAAKVLRPDLPVVWGGWHPSLFPTETLEEPAIDATVIGQGERTFAELVTRLARGEGLHGLRGTACRLDGEPTLNPPRPLTCPSASYAYDYDLIPVETYFERKGRRQLDYVSSIGCRFRCGFCADSLVYGREWFGLEAKRVEREVAHLWELYRFDDLSFQDEAFFTDQSRVVAIVQGFLRRGLHVSWRATLRPDQGARLPNDVLSLCRRSGLRRVLVGVESGSQEILDWITKDTRVDQVLACAEKLLRCEVAGTFSFIVGFPGESEESVRATLGLAKRLRAMSPRFETPIFYFKPYPGSLLGRDVHCRGHTLPETLDAWADFDYVGSSGAWVSAEKRRLVERFKFYNRFAWGGDGRYYWPLQVLARWRCERDEYRLPWEKVLVERVKPADRLS